MEAESSENWGRPGIAMTSGGCEVDMGGWGLWIGWVGPVANSAGPGIAHHLDG